MGPHGCVLFEGARFRLLFFLQGSQKDTIHFEGPQFLDTPACQLRIDESANAHRISIPRYGESHIVPRDFTRHKSTQHMLRFWLRPFNSSCHKILLWLEIGCTLPPTNMKPPTGSMLVGGRANVCFPHNCVSPSSWGLGSLPGAEPSRSEGACTVFSGCLIPLLAKQFVWRLHICHNVEDQVVDRGTGMTGFPNSTFEFL